MNDLLASFTALPNLHPAVVHFPIALAVMALAVEFASLLFRRQVWLEKAAALVYGAAAITAGTAYLAGRQAASSIGAVPPRAELVLADHADFALLALITLAVAAILRVTASFVDRERPVARVGLLRLCGLLVMIGANALLAVTADHGGELVFRFGVAVTSATTPVIEEPTGVGLEEETSAEQRITRGEDGSLEWAPVSLDIEALGTILQPAAGISMETVSARLPVAGSPGLWLETNGSSVLCLPEIFGDVSITAELDLSGFEGTAGLAHHVQSVDAGVFVTLTSTGEVALIRRSNGSTTEFDVGTVSAPAQQLTLGTSAVGRHLKGQIDGQTVVHGHGSSGDAGAVGLLLEGHGVVGIHRLSVTPLETH
jgi:uncharacterized membrane protein